MTKAEKAAKALAGLIAGYTSKIGEAKNHDELKAVGAALANDDTIDGDTRTAIVRIYRTKLNDLDRKMVTFSRNNNFKKLMYSINTLTADTCSAVGKTIYELAHTVDEKEQPILNKHEADLAFRSYWRQKNKLANAAA